VYIYLFLPNGHTRNQVMSYSPKTIWVELVNCRKLHWKCECGHVHPLDLGRYVLHCSCGQVAGFVVGFYNNELNLYSPLT
jgi:hypothetical protein